jgi:hypothetical protein
MNACQPSPTVTVVAADAALTENTRIAAAINNTRLIIRLHALERGARTQWSANASLRPRAQVSIKTSLHW